jgi:hypothetical protein
MVSRKLLQDTIDRKTSLTDTVENKGKRGCSGPCLYELCKVFLNVELTVTLVPEIYVTLLMM